MSLFGRGRRRRLRLSSRLCLSNRLRLSNRLPGRRRRLRLSNWLRLFARGHVPKRKRTTARTRNHLIGRQTPLRLQRHQPALAISMLSKLRRRRHWSRRRRSRVQSRVQSRVPRKRCNPIFGRLTLQSRQCCRLRTTRPAFCLSQRLGTSRSDGPRKGTHELAETISPYLSQTRWLSVTLVSLSKDLLRCRRRHQKRHNRRQDTTVAETQPPPKSCRGWPTRRALICRTGRKPQGRRRHLPPLQHPRSATVKRPKSFGCHRPSQALLSRPSLHCHRKGLLQRRILSSAANPLPR
jgi:hypothetical protein